MRISTQERETHTHRDRETDRQTETERERQRQRQTDRQTDREREGGGGCFTTAKLDKDYKENQRRTTPNTPCPTDHDKTHHSFNHAHTESTKAWRMKEFLPITRVRN